MRKLLILDIDETLIHGTETPLPSPCDFKAGGYWVYKRPHLEDFLAYCFANWDVAFWTSADESYASIILENILAAHQIPAFTWTKEKCTLKYNPDTGQYYHLKNLKKVKKKGFSLESVLMVDDIRENLCLNYGNLLLISKFEGKTDDELKYLTAYLKKAEAFTDIRKKEKRGWKHQGRVIIFS
ncbi:MAG: HAD family hydrolase [bacterium]|nr:HAD family hydrolase [bacterium]